MSKLKQEVIIGQFKNYLFFFAAIGLCFVGNLIYVVAPIAAYFLFAIGVSGRRINGMRVEAHALSTLRPPSGFLAKKSVPVPGLGDCDLLIINDDAKFAVEIKSTINVQVRSWLGVTFFPNFNLLKLPPRSNLKDPLGQALALSARLEAVPVVWFPLGINTGIYKVKEVYVVIGRQRLLWKLLRRIK